MNSFKRNARDLAISLTNFIVNRFPFWDAFSTALLLGEYEVSGRRVPIPNITVYIHIGLQFLFATSMSFFPNQQAVFAMVAAVQVVISTVAYCTYFSVANWMMYIKILSRGLGTCFAYVSIACFRTDTLKHRSRLWRLASTLAAVVVACEAYLLNTSSVEASIFNKAIRMNGIPFKEFGIWIISFLLVLCALCFVTMKNVKSALKCMIVVWLVLTMLIDINIKEWMKFTDLWTQYRIVAADICIVSTCILIYCKIVE